MGKRAGSIVYPHTQKDEEPQGGKKGEEEQVILSSHTETYRNKKRHMKPHIKEPRREKKGFR